MGIEPTTPLLAGPPDLKSGGDTSPRPPPEVEKNLNLHPTFSNFNQKFAVNETLFYFFI